MSGLKQRIVGFDPSMKNWGVAIGLYDTENEEVQITDLDVISPKVNTSVGSKSYQDLQRAEQLAEGVFKIMEWYNPDRVYVEVPHGSQSARAMASYAMCLGVLGSMRALSWDFVPVKQSQVKMAAVGKKDATKDEMIEWAVHRHAMAPWPMRKLKNKEVIQKGRAEHMADAIGAIHAGLDII
jgi:Holliday junction resolvasome RuvABC endonuclease subunit